MSVFPSSTNTCGVFFPEGFSLFRESNSLGNLGSPARQRIGHHWESLDFFDGGNLNRRIQKRPPFGAALRHSPIEGGRFGPGKSGKLIVTVKQDSELKTQNSEHGMVCGETRSRARPPPGRRPHPRAHAPTQGNVQSVRTAAAPPPHSNNFSAGALASAWDPRITSAQGP